MDQEEDIDSRGMLPWRTIARVADVETIFTTYRRRFYLLTSSFFLVLSHAACGVSKGIGPLLEVIAHMRKRRMSITIAKGPATRGRKLFSAIFD